MKPYQVGTPGIREKQGAFCYISKISLTRTTVSKSVTCTQKTENIKFSGVSKLFFFVFYMFTHFFLFRPDKSNFEVSLHFLRSWPTVQQRTWCNRGILVYVCMCQIWYVYRRLGSNEMPLCSVFTPLCRAATLRRAAAAALLYIRFNVCIVI